MARPVFFRAPAPSRRRKTSGPSSSGPSSSSPGNRSRPKSTFGMPAASCSNPAAPATTSAFAWAKSRRRAFSISSRSASYWTICPPGRDDVQEQALGSMPWCVYRSDTPKRPRSAIFVDATVPPYPAPRSSVGRLVMVSEGGMPMPEFASHPRILRRSPDTAVSARCLDSRLIMKATPRRHILTLSLLFPLCIQGKP
jgi:hypothetical protein